VAEEARHGVVGALCEPRGAHQQLFLAPGVEARIGAQVMKERCEISREAGLGDDRLHLAADARDLVEPDLVDRFGGGVERGVVAHQRAVEVAPAGHLGDADAGARRGHVLVPEEVRELAVGGQGMGFDRGERRRAQPLLLRRRQVGGERLERREQGAGFRCRGGKLLDLLQHAGQDVVRLHHPGREATPQPGDLLVEITRQGLDATDPGLGLRHVAWPRAEPEVDRLGKEAAVVAEREALGLVAGELDRGTQQVLQHRVADLPAVRERHGVDALQPGQEGFVLAAAFRHRFGRCVRPARRGLEVALAPGANRVVLQLEGLEVRHQRVEFRCGVRPRCRATREQDDRQQDAGHESMGHRGIPRRCRNGDGPLFRGRNGDCPLFEMGTVPISGLQCNFRCGRMIRLRLLSRTISRPRTGPYISIRWRRYSDR
jgi:hypothetical protein